MYPSSKPYMGYIKDAVNEYEFDIRFFEPHDSLFIVETHIVKANTLEEATDITEVYAEACITDKKFEAVIVDFEIEYYEKNGPVGEQKDLRKQLQEQSTVNLELQSVLGTK